MTVVKPRPEFCRLGYEQSAMAAAAAGKL